MAIATGQRKSKAPQLPKLSVEKLEEEIRQNFLDEYRKRLFDLGDKRSILQFCKDVNISYHSFQKFMADPAIQQEIANINNELMMTTWNPNQCLKALTTIAQDNIHKEDGQAIALQAVNTILKAHHDNRKFVHTEKIDNKKLENAEHGNQIMKLLKAKHKVIEAEKDDQKA